MTGPEMVERILQQKASIKVLFMTGYVAGNLSLPNAQALQRDFETFYPEYAHARCARMPGPGGSLTHIES